jgi:hypothetical protein
MEGSFSCAGISARWRLSLCHIFGFRIENLALFPDVVVSEGRSSSCLPALWCVQCGSVLATTPLFYSWPYLSSVKSGVSLSGHGLKS